MDDMNNKVGIKKINILQGTKIIYILMIFFLSISMLGLPIPYLKYLVYTLPYVIFLVWLLQMKYRLYPSRHTLPFLLLLGMAVFSIGKSDYNTIRQGGFILTYTAVFVLCDFRKIGFNVLYINALFVGLFVVRMFTELLVVASGTFEYSIIESHSSLESGYAFIFGLFTLYYLVKKRYLLVLINLVLACLTLKRIVLVGIMASVMVWFIPRKVRRVFLNPYVVTVCVLLLMYFSIEMTRGSYDRFIVDLTGMSLNHLLQGRQDMWLRVLQKIDFNYFDYLFYGVGLGQTRTVISEIFHQNTILHSDFLAIMLEYGIVTMCGFCILLNIQKSDEERLLALFLTILFLTDNVLSYVYVMLPYLLLQADLAKIASGNERAVIRSG